jgi:hypothetical protein
MITERQALWTLVAVIVFCTLSVWYNTVETNKITAEFEYVTWEAKWAMLDVCTTYPERTRKICVRITLKDLTNKVTHLRD